VNNLKRNNDIYTINNYWMGDSEMGSKEDMG
jgi:hypothetical protein